MTRSFRQAFQIVGVTFLAAVPVLYTRLLFGILSISFFVSSLLLELLYTSFPWWFLLVSFLFFFSSSRTGTIVVVFSLISSPFPSSSFPHHPHLTSAYPSPAFPPTACAYFPTRWTPSGPRAARSTPSRACLKRSPPRRATRPPRLPGPAAR